MGKEFETRNLWNEISIFEKTDVFENGVCKFTGKELDKIFFDFTYDVRLC